MKIALFGGSFNPPHNGHIHAIKKLAHLKEFDEVWIIPSAQHPFNKDLAPFKARVHMLELCLKNIKKVKIIKIENELPKPNKTIDTIHALKKEFPTHAFSFIIGSDLLEEIRKWKDYKKIESEVEIIVMVRKKIKHKKSPYRMLRLDLPGISSSDIREDSKRNVQYVPKNIQEIVRKFYCKLGLLPR